jgi:hypothetical protein
MIDHMKVLRSSVGDLPWRHRRGLKKEKSDRREGTDPKSGYKALGACVEHSTPVLLRFLPDDLERRQRDAAGHRSCTPSIWRRCLKIRFASMLIVEHGVIVATLPRARRYRDVHHPAPRAELPPVEAASEM